MDQIVFSRKSWIFRFICWFNPRNCWRPPETICHYTREFLSCLFKLIGNVAVGCLVVTALGVIFLKESDCRLVASSCVAMKANYGIFAKIGIAMACGTIMAAIGVAGVFAILIGISQGLEKLEEIWTGVKKNPDPGTLIKMYRAFKEKLCYRIEFK
jgi:hypothetical protein